MRPTPQFLYGSVTLCKREGGSLPEYISSINELLRLQKKPVPESSMVQGVKEYKENGFHRSAGYGGEDKGEAAWRILILFPFLIKELIIILIRDLAVFSEGKAVSRFEFQYSNSTLCKGGLL